MGCLPYFKFYPADWLSDRKVTRLSPAARCLYWDLLATAWKEGGIDADVDELAADAALRNMNRRQFDTAWRQVEQFWVHGPEGRLVNPRQEREREEAERVYQQRVEAGRKGGRPSGKQTESKR